MNQKIYTDKTGVKINYYEIGSGRPFLFFHGSIVDALSYRNFINEMSKNFHVIAPDIPGFGKSSNPLKNWDSQDLIDCMGRFISSLSFESIISSGHSLGGYIAANTCKNSKVSDLVLIDSAGIQIKNSFLGYLRGLLIKTKKELAPPYIKDFFILAATGAKNMIKRFDKIPFIFMLYKSCLTEETKFNFITKPSLIIFNQDSEFFDEEYWDRFIKYFEKPKLLILPGNHDGIFFYPNRYAHEISESI